MKLSLPTVCFFATASLASSAFAANPAFDVKCGILTNSSNGSEVRPVVTVNLSLKAGQAVELYRNAEVVYSVKIGNLPREVGSYDLQISARAGVTNELLNRIEVDLIDNVQTKVRFYGPNLTDVKPAPRVEILCSGQQL